MVSFLHLIGSNCNGSVRTLIDSTLTATVMVIKSKTEQASREKLKQANLKDDALKIYLDQHLLSQYGLLDKLVYKMKQRA